MPFRIAEGAMGPVEGDGKDPYAEHDAEYKANLETRNAPSRNAIEASAAQHQKSAGGWPLDYPGIPGTSAPPVVSSTTPTNGAVGVPVGVSPEITFNEQMASDKVNATNIKLRPQGGGEGSDIAATVSYNANTNKATINPDADLLAATPYTVTVLGGPTGIQDSDGIPIAANYSFSFTTA